MPDETWPPAAARSATDNPGVRIAAPVTDTLVLPPAGTEVEIVLVGTPPGGTRFAGSFAGLTAATDGSVAVPVAIELRDARDDGWSSTLIPWSSIGGMTWRHVEADRG